MAIVDWQRRTWDDMELNHHEYPEFDTKIRYNDISKTATPSSNAGFKFRNEYGVNMVLDATRPFKFLGTFKTRGDVSPGKLVDNRMSGKDIAIIPVKIKMVSAGSNNMYMYPSKISVVGNQIKWEYSHIKPTPVHDYFHGIMDTTKGTDTIYEITWRYGYF